MGRIAGVILEAKMRVHVFISRLSTTRPAIANGRFSLTI